MKQVILAGRAVAALNTIAAGVHIMHPDGKAWAVVYNAVVALLMLWLMQVKAVQYEQG